MSLVNSSGSKAELGREMAKYYLKQEVGKIDATNLKTAEDFLEQADKSLYNKEMLAVYCSVNKKFNQLINSAMGDAEISAIVSMYDEILNYSNGIEKAKDIYDNSKYLIDDINDYPFIKSFLE